MLLVAMTARARLLHEITFFIGAFRGRDKRHANPDRSFALISAKLATRPDRGPRPTTLRELAAFADKWFRQPVRTVHEVPTKFSFDAGGDAIRCPSKGSTFKMWRSFVQNVKAASHAANTCRLSSYGGCATPACGIRLPRAFRIAP